jgi:tetratricopeptide (TPR) repeat protein
MVKGRMKGPLTYLVSGQLSPKPSLISLLVLCILLPIANASAASFLEQGESALRNNQPDRAKALFEAFLNQNPGDEKALLYLGVSELQLGDLTNAADTFKKGLSVASTLKDIFYYNIGNVYFMQSQNTLADGMYSQAIKANPNLSDAYLNRANARMRLDNYDGAAADYTVYLSLKPNAPQRPEIEQLLSLLQQAKAEAAQQAVLAEQKKKEAAAHQQALLNSVLQSLNNASNSTTNLQAGTAAIQDTKTNLGLDD